MRRDRLKGIKPIWDLVQSTVAAITLVSLLHAQSTVCWCVSLCSPVWICWDMYQADSNLKLFVESLFSSLPFSWTQDFNCLNNNGSWRRLHRMPILRSAVQVALDRWWKSFTSTTWSSICVLGRCNNLCRSYVRSFDYVYISSSLYHSLWSFYRFIQLLLCNHVETDAHLVAIC